MAQKRYSRALWYSVYPTILLSVIVAIIIFIKVSLWLVGTGVFVVGIVTPVLMDKWLQKKHLGSLGITIVTATSVREYPPIMELTGQGYKIQVGKDVRSSM